MCVTSSKRSLGDLLRDGTLDLRTRTSAPAVSHLHTVAHLLGVNRHIFLKFWFDKEKKKAENVVPIEDKIAEVTTLEL